MWVVQFAVTCMILAYGFANPSCNPGKDGMLNVHLVCHTHDDVGWLKTVDQYYYGSQNSIQRAGVQYILDSVVRSLLEDPNKKFIYVESAFFFRWWDEQTDKMKQDVKGLVERGQLEFIGGGWSMNDEAGAHYNAIIDQMTLGLRKLNDTFGEAGRPTIGWQIDPFGHSREQASLFSQMGFNGLFFGRVDHDDKSTRQANKTMEMVWQASDDLGEAAWLFTGVLPNGYGPPAGFCFDILCSDEPIMDDPRLHDYNVDQKVNDFLSVAASQGEWYHSQHTIMTMGMDFHYQNAHAWYKQLDKLIRYVNARQENGSKVNIFYSTPSCYLDSLHKADLKWPTKTDDFFPYASGNHSYWTGYFTSRPTLKGHVRATNAFLQAVKQVAVLLGVGADPRLERLKEAMGVLQHHDAVSGTAKQHVTDDYTLRLDQGVTQSFEMVAEAYSKLHSDISEDDPMVFCPLLNISSCEVTEKASTFLVTVYNPLAKPRGHLVRIPVPAGVAYKVTDYKGNAVEVQLVPLPAPLLNLPGRNSTAKFDLAFMAQDIPPLGYLQFHVQKSTSRRILAQQMSTVHTYTDNQDIVLQAPHQGLALGVDNNTGLLKSIGVVKPDGIQMLKVNQTFLWYAGVIGNNSKEEFRSSGAYSFRPNATSAFPVSEKATIMVVQGPVVNEIHQEWGDWVSQVLRVFPDHLMLEMEWLVGPIPISDGVGKEVVSRVIWDDTDTDYFFTDSNGREMIKRVIDYRPSWKLDNQEPVAGNYYPVNSRLILDTGNTTKTLFQAALLNDRSQGGTSLGPGHMELMVHRRLLHDDSFGVGEPLNETAYGRGLVARGKHYLFHKDFSSSKCDFGCVHRTAGEMIMLPPVITFTPTTATRHTWTASHTTKWSGVRGSVPWNVHLLTLEPVSESHILVRLEHQYQHKESSLDSPATVDIQDLLADWEIVSAQEMTLAANLAKEDDHHYQWNIETEGEMTRSENVVHGTDRQSTNQAPSFSVTLNPMEIKTFILEVKKATSRF